MQLKRKSALTQNSDVSKRRNNLFKESQYKSQAQLGMHNEHTIEWQVPHSCTIEKMGIIIFFWLRLR